jgi:nitroimidazol reductase NimA-like FMN-containing flavoprotein (pyridoxamine 5'-phosphate oxidase superfamily)
MSVRLSEEEAWEVLRTAHTGILVTLRRDGSPIALPVWFVVDDHTIYVSGPKSGKKFSRVGNDDRVSFLVESGEAWRELCAVHVSGRAEVVAEPDWERIDGLLGEKYLGFITPREQMPERTREHYDVGRALLRIVPEGRMLTWDNSRLDVGS